MTNRIHRHNYLNNVPKYIIILFEIWNSMLVCHVHMYQAGDRHHLPVYQLRLRTLLDQFLLPAPPPRACQLVAVRGRWCPTPETRGTRREGEERKYVTSAYPQELPDLIRAIIKQVIIFIIPWLLSHRLRDSLPFGNAKRVEMEKIDIVMHRYHLFLVRQKAGMN